MYIAQNAVNPEICVPSIGEMLYSKFCIRPLIKYQLQIELSSNCDQLIFLPNWQYNTMQWFMLDTNSWAIFIKGR